MRPTLRDSLGDAVCKMPPLLVQPKRWELRYVKENQQQDQQEKELRRFTLTGMTPSCSDKGMFLPDSIRDLCGQAYVQVQVAPEVRKGGTARSWEDVPWPEVKILPLEVATRVDVPVTAEVEHPSKETTVALLHPCKKRLTSPG
jgi:hypothetical protein